MDLADVVRRATLNPALILGEEDEIGTLAPGSRADLTILDLAEGRWTLTDSMGEELVVDRRLVPGDGVPRGQGDYPRPPSPARRLPAGDARRGVAADSVRAPFDTRLRRYSG